MTEDIDELASWLRDFSGDVGYYNGKTLEHIADVLEKLAGDNQVLKLQLEAKRTTYISEELERLSLFARFANSAIEGMVEEAIAYKKAHGKYPFED